MTSPNSLSAVTASQKVRNFLAEGDGAKIDVADIEALIEEIARKDEALRLARPAIRVPGVTFAEMMEQHKRIDAALAPKTQGEGE